MMGTTPKLLLPGALVRHPQHLPIPKPPANVTRPRVLGATPPYAPRPLVRAASVTRWGAGQSSIYILIALQRIGKGISCWLKELRGRW